MFISFMTIAKTAPARCNGCLHVTGSDGTSDALWDAYADVSTRFHGRPMMVAPLGAGKCSKTTRKMHEKSVKTYEHAGKSMKSRFEDWEKQVLLVKASWFRPKWGVLGLKLLHFQNAFCSALHRINVASHIMYTSENSIGESCTAPKNIRNCPRIASRKTTGYPLSWLFQKYGV